MELFLTIVASLGVGSLISVVAQSLFANKAAADNRIFKERKEAYIGLLESWRDQDIEGITDENIYSVGHWHLRAQLVASKEMYDALENWSDTEPGSSPRQIATKTVKFEMRLDLKKARK